jgi:hypothetical protein
VRGTCRDGEPPVRASRDQEDARPSAHRPARRRRRAALAPPGGRVHRFTQPGRRPASARPLTRWQSSGSAAPTMMTEPCDLRLPASAGRPAAGQGTIHAVMLITGSSASGGSRVRGGRSYLADRRARGLPGLSSSLPGTSRAPARTQKIRILRCARDIHGGNCQGPEQHFQRTLGCPTRTGRTALRGSPLPQPR